MSRWVESIATVSDIAIVDGAATKVGVLQKTRILVMQCMISMYGFKRFMQ